jgi:lysophospholipase L1-like esterase
VETVCFIGDSIVESWNTSEYFGSVKTINYGIAGDSINGVLSRLPKCLIEKPEKIVILVGTNDTRTIIGSKEPERIIELINVKFKNLFDSFDSLGIQYFVISILPVSNKWISQLTDNVNNIHRAINSQIQRELSIRKNGKYIDAYSQMKDHRNAMLDVYTTDGVHLTKIGYEKLSNSVIPDLLSD